MSRLPARACRLPAGAPARSSGVGEPAPRTAVATLPGVPRPPIQPVRRQVDGRTLVNRAALAETTGEHPDTLAKWWRARERNGHPAVQELDGEQVVDLVDWRAWHAEYTGDRRMIDGVEWLSRAELARRSGESIDNMDMLWKSRATNGHPPGRRVGRKLFHPGDQWTTWHARRRARIREGLTTVDRSGDPDELLGLGDAARLLGYTSPSTILKYIERGQWPPPDQVDLGPRGNQLRKYRRQTLWTIADHRSRSWPGASRRDPSDRSATDRAGSAGIEHRP